MLVRLTKLTIGLILLSSNLLLAQSVKTYIPPQAFQYFDTIKDEVSEHLSNFYPTRIHYFPALIEHESCTSLKSKRCWNPTSRLKSAREEGAGLGQITRAYTKDGRLRMDTLTSLHKAYSRELKDLSWENVYQRPDLQIRAMVLLSKENYNRLNIRDIEPLERIAFTDAAYNGGLGGVNNERRACGLAKNCNPDKWFDNTERYCLKSKAAIYGDRGPCVINRHHVRDVIYTRMNKYQPYFDIKENITKQYLAPIVRSKNMTSYNYIKFTTYKDN